MKVLSVRQPWAWLIVAGYKDIENRTWSTPYRGELAIHASSSFDHYFFDLEDPTDPLYKYCALVRDHFGIKPGTRKITRNQHELSAIVGTVQLTGCMVADDISPDINSDWCFYCGYAWKMEHAVQWEKPITGIKGKLNIWNYTPEAEQQKTLNLF